MKRYVRAGVATTSNELNLKFQQVLTSAIQKEMFDEFIPSDDLSNIRPEYVKALNAGHYGAYSVFNEPSSKRASADVLISAFKSPYADGVGLAGLTDILLGGDGSCNNMSMLELPNRISSILHAEESTIEGILKSLGFSLETRCWLGDDGWYRTSIKLNEGVDNEALSPEGSELLAGLGVTTFDQLGSELGDMKFDYAEMESRLDDANWDYTSPEIKRWVKGVANEWLANCGWPDMDTSEEMHKDRVKIWQQYYEDVQEFANDRTAGW